MAFVSTPSVYFSLPSEFKEQSTLLEYDQKFKGDKGFVFYDFNKPLELDGSLEGKYDFILIDPPFITEEVWAKVPDSYIYLSTLLRPNSCSHQLVSYSCVRSRRTRRCCRLCWRSNSVSANPRSRTLFTSTISTATTTTHAWTRLIRRWAID
jgi:hypothetical protein